MDPSRADRILSDWDAASRHVRRPGLPPRTVVNSTVSGSTIAAAVVLVLAIAAVGVWIGRPPGDGSVGAEASPSLTAASPSAAEPSAAEQSPSQGPSPIEVWGPLAVTPPDDGADQARNEGTLRITDTCVLLERGGEVELLIWGADSTTWDEASRSITFQNLDGTVITVRDGDYLELGGGGDSTAESGVSREELLRRIDWVAPPSPSCPTDPSWSVGHVGATTPLEGPFSVDGCQVVVPLRLPSGVRPLETEELPDRKFGWGSGEDRIVEGLGLFVGSPDPSDVPDDSPQRVVIRGSPALVVPVGDPGVGEIAITWESRDCAYTIWLAPGHDLEAAIEYAAGF